MNILSINSGSSSLKAHIFQIKKQPKLLIKFHVDGIGKKSCKFTYSSINKNIGQKQQIKNHTEAIELLFSHLEEIDIKAIGQRVVHGGEKYKQPTKITKTVLDELHKLIKLAPLHNPINIESIKAVQKIKPKTPQIAIFDTAFHQTMPEKAYLYAIPDKYHDKDHIRRYGFHGTNHQYVVNQARKISKSNKKVISCHLGNGASITASISGKSIDTSMGLSPLAGIPMGTRSGDLDPSIVLELAEKIGIEKTNIMLNNKSGLLALSNISSDMREIYQKSKEGDPKALLTIEILAYQIAKYCGAYAAALKGVDTIIFTGGLGEKAWYVRKQVCAYFDFLGLKLDHNLNRQNQTKISDNKSKIKVYVIPANEGLEIALETAKSL